MVRTTSRNRQRAAAQEQSQPETTQEQEQPATRTRNRTRSNGVDTAAAGSHSSAQEDTGAQQERTAAPQAQSNGASTMSERERDDTEHQSRQVATRPEQRSLAQPAGRNAFESYGQQMSISSITGTLIKFNKGDWVTGDDEDLEDDTELVFNMDQLLIGWIKWIDQRPTEQIMGPVAEGFQPARRNELGDTDQSQWELDEQGRPRDPWQLSNYIVCKDPGQDASDENLYTFATSSKGGLGAIGKLCQQYGRAMRERPDEYPIVRLGSDYYNHAQYGRTYVPEFTIVGWEPKAQFAEVAQPSEPEPTAAPTPVRGNGRSRRATA